MVVNIWSFVPLGETEFIVACRTKLKSDFQRVYVLPYGRFARKVIHLTPRSIFDLLVEILKFYLIFIPVRQDVPNHIAVQTLTKSSINSSAHKSWIIEFITTILVLVLVSQYYFVSQTEELKIQNDSFAYRVTEYDT